LNFVSCAATCSRWRKKDINRSQAVFIQIPAHGYIFKKTILGLGFSLLSDKKKYCPFTKRGRLFIPPGKLIQTIPHDLTPFIGCSHQDGIGFSHLKPGSGGDKGRNKRKIKLAHRKAWATDTITDGNMCGCGIVH